MSTINQAQLVAPQAMPTTDGALYTTPALTLAKIGRAVFSNTDTVNPHTITANISNGVSNASNQLINARVLAPGETYVSPELAGAVVPAGQQVRGSANSNTVTVTISGITVTG